MPPISGQEIVEALGFTSESSPEWKAFVGPFKKNFLGPREDIQKGFQYFDQRGDKTPWDACIQEMFNTYPDVWHLNKFPGPFSGRNRAKFGHAFLVAQTKKLRQKRGV